MFAAVMTSALVIASTADVGVPVALASSPASAVAVALMFCSFIVPSYYYQMPR